MEETVANAQPSVLVVDDERGPRESIRLALEPRFRVMTVESGTEALDVLHLQKFDVVTLDLMMPGLDGVATFRGIRELDSDVEIIFVAATESLVENLARILPCKPSALIPKPFETAQLVQAVERAVEMNRRSRESASELEVAASSRRDVARMFTHDIKNRLSVVLGYVRLLRERGSGELDNLDGVQALDAIESNTHEAVTLAVNFLHAENSDGAQLSLHKKPASLAEIVNRVVKDETSFARLKRIDLQTDLDLGLATMDLDVGMIARALTNLVDNALDCSPEGSVVRIAARCFGSDMILRVVDSGPGIPVEQVPRLFQRYGRGARSESSGSTGLGLYLVKRIAEAHGGCVSVTFPPEGGSAFVIVLPFFVNADA